MSKRTSVDPYVGTGKFTAVWIIMNALLVGAITSGCSDPKNTEEVVPRVKVFTVGKKATGQSRRISGKIHAADKSSLSFGVGGKVVEIIVSEGEKLAAGQLLARLDEEPQRIRLEDARAKRSNARAKFLEAKTAFDRNEKLYNQRGASLQELETATANLATADGDLKAAQGLFSQSELDFAHTKLVAPFAGKIEKVLVDPFQEVGASDEILVLHGSAFCVCP